jgi:hypothetical protein
LKYFTWIEQQGKDLEELNAQMDAALEYDKLIADFNVKTGLLEKCE